MPIKFDGLNDAIIGVTASDDKIVYDAHRILTLLSEQSGMNKTAYDRGAADSYYSRAMIPHKMVDGEQVLLERGQEWDEYMEGYACNEDLGNFKDWGTP